MSVLKGMKFRYQEDLVIGKYFLPTLCWKNEGPIFMKHKINLNVAAYMNIHLINLRNVLFLVVGMKTTV